MRISKKRKRAAQPNFTKSTHEWTTVVHSQKVSDTV